MKEFFSKDDIVEAPAHIEGVTALTEYLNRLLRERSQVVYRKSAGLCAESWTRGEHDARDATHTALLINIEPIAEPDTAESLLKELMEFWDFPDTMTATQATARPQLYAVLIKRARTLLKGLKE